MTKARAVLPIFVLLSAALGIPAHVGAQNLAVTLKKDDKGALKVDQITPSTSPVAMTTDGILRVVITCLPDVDCKTARLWVGVAEGTRDEMTATKQEPRLAEFTVSGTLVPESPAAAPKQFPLLVAFEATGAGVAVVHLVRTKSADGTTQGAAPGGGGIRSIAPFLTRDCSALRPPPLAANPVTMGVGVIYVEPTGAVLSRPPQGFTERDVLEVRVIMDPSLVGVLSAVRTSDIRDVARRLIQGADVQIPADVIKRLQAGDAPKPCVDWPLYVFDFAPGRGVVQLQALLADGTVGKTGSFDIAVRPVYAGAFSLGAMHTWLAKPTFGLIKKGADSVIVERSGGSRVLYTVLYTYFFKGLRDVMDGALSVNPSVGVTLTDVGKNALVGITVDGGAAFFLTYGVHAGEVSELQPKSDLHVGTVFPGPSSDIPTRTRWKAAQFLAITVDIRAALGLLRAALGTATAGGG